MTNRPDLVTNRRERDVEDRLQDLLDVEDRLRDLRSATRAAIRPSPDLLDRIRAATKINAGGGAPTEEPAVVGGTDLVALVEAAREVEAITALPHPCQALLHMLTMTPTPSYQDISEALGMPLGSIGPVRARCFALLRRRMEAIYERRGIEGSPSGAPDTDEHAANPEKEQTHGVPARPAGENPYHLSDREREVWHLLSEGLTNKQIGQQLLINEKTVRTVIIRLFHELM